MHSRHRFCTFVLPIVTALAAVAIADLDYAGTAPIADSRQRNGTRGSGRCILPGYR
jgi:hypothetical protein